VSTGGLRVTSGPNSGPIQGSSPLLQGSSPTLQGGPSVLQGPGALIAPSWPYRNLDDPQPVNSTESKTEHFSRPLYVGAPDYKTVAQGAIGDCYFVAAVAGLAKSDPTAIQRMIVDNGDGTYTVTFAGSRRVTVDGDLYVNSSGKPSFGQLGTDGSMWFPILEKAYAQLRGGYDDLDRGGTSATGINDLLGFADPMLTTAWDPDATWRVLSSQVEAGRPVVVGTPPNPPNDMLRPNHAYMVEGVIDAGGVRRVQLFNPHGFDGSLQYLGRFTIPYDLFLQNFTEFSIPAGDVSAAMAAMENVA
jgi:hypothetical protein